MNDEQISALMDDALPAPAQTAALDELLAQPAARATWARYHLIGDALRAEPLATPAARPLPDNVIPLPQRDAPRRPLAGLGLAAAVAMVAVAINALGPRTAPEVVQAGATQPPAQVKFVAAEPSAATPAARQDAELVSDDADQPLEGYMYNFNEQRARQGTPGVHPYVHTVGYDAR